MSELPKGVSVMQFNCVRACGSHRGVKARSHFKVKQQPAPTSSAIEYTAADQKYCRLRNSERSPSGKTFWLTDNLPSPFGAGTGNRERGTGKKIAPKNMGSRAPEFIHEKNKNIFFATHSARKNTSASNQELLSMGISLLPVPRSLFPFKFVTEKRTKTTLWQIEIV